MTAARRISKFEVVLLSALFVAAISLPLFKQLMFGEKEETILVEYRDPHPLPKVTMKHLKVLKQYPAEFEAYYNDNFGFRSDLLRLAAVVKVKLLGVSAARTVLIGKSGWLYLKDAYTYLGTTNLTSYDLENWQNKFEERRNWLAQRGIRYLYMLAPNKQSVYPEFMPATFNGTGIEPMTDQLEHYLSTHSDFSMFPLRETLLDAKKNSQYLLYYPQDTHWNSLGAYVGYRAIILKMQQWFPELKPQDRSDYRTVTAAKHGDLGRMTGVSNFSVREEPEMEPLTPDSFTKSSFKLPGVDHPLGTEPFTTENSNAPSKLKIVILRDSFGTSLVPYFSRNFARVTSIWSTEGNLHFEKILADFIEKEKPDVFIEERTERVLLGTAPPKGTQFGGPGN